MSYQLTIIVGNVGADAEMKYLKDGTAVTNFNVAVSKVRGKGEARQETTVWIRVSTFGNLAEISGQYVKKGMRVLVSGEIKASAYTTQTGEVRASLELTANEMRMLSSKNEMGGNGGGYGGGNAGGDDDGGELYNAPAQAPARGGGAAASGSSGNRRPARGNEPTYTDPEDIPF